jgi:cytochrome c556
MTLMRKLFTLAAATTLAAFGFTALAAQDFGEKKETKTHKVMEKVQVQNGVILKGVRTPAQFSKSKDDIVKAAKELVKLGKEAKDYTEASESQKQPQEKWVELMEKFIKETEDFTEKAEADDAKQAEIKDAYKAVQKTCSNCHDVFKKEEP